MDVNDVHSGDISLPTPSNEETMEVGLLNFQDSGIILKRKHEKNLVKGCKKRKLYQPMHRCDKIDVGHVNSNVCDNEDTSFNNETQNLVHIFEELKEELNNIVTCAVDKVLQNFKNKYKHLINNEVHNKQLNTDVIQKSPINIFPNLNVQFPNLLNNPYNKFYSNNIINSSKPEIKHNPDINSNNYDRLLLEHNIDGNKEIKTTFPILKNYIKEYTTLFNNHVAPFDKDNKYISGKSEERFDHDNCHQKGITIKEDNNKVGVTNSICLHKVHLRKAKLMFFWVRYPSSAVLKSYFPGIKFTKNNTGQLVKWFSNFREFFYKSIETYTRRVIAETEIISKGDDAFKINRNSELLRTLNVHYNYNNAVVPPQEFLDVVERTVKEFYLAIIMPRQAEKSSEQSWKKSVYKVVARLDNVVPEYFKETDFLEKLK